MQSAAHPGPRQADRLGAFQFIMIKRDAQPRPEVVLLALLQELQASCPIISEPLANRIESLQIFPGCLKIPGGPGFPAWVIACFRLRLHFARGSSIITRSLKPIPPVSGQVLNLPPPETVLRQLLCRSQ